MSYSEEEAKISEIAEQLFKDLKESRVHKRCTKVSQIRYEQKFKREIEKHQKELVVLRGKRREAEEKLEAKKEEINNLKDRKYIDIDLIDLKVLKCELNKVLKEVSAVMGVNFIFNTGMLVQLFYTGTHVCVVGQLKRLAL